MKTINFTDRAKGYVKLKHYSTSSQIKMTIVSYEEITQGGPMEEVTSEVWFDYESFEDLIDIMKEFCNEDN